MRATRPSPSVRAKSNATCNCAKGILSGSWIERLGTDRQRNRSLEPYWNTKPTSSGSILSGILKALSKPPPERERETERERERERARPEVCRRHNTRRPSPMVTLEAWWGARGRQMLDWTCSQRQRKCQQCSRSLCAAPLTLRFCSPCTHDLGLGAPQRHSARLRLLPTHIMTYICPLHPP